MNTEKFTHSKNHIIKWKRSDNIKTCDLSKNCSEISIDIFSNRKQARAQQQQQINNQNNISFGNMIFEKLPTGISSKNTSIGTNINEYFDSEKANRISTLNENIIVFLLVFLLGMILFLRSK